MKKHVRKIYIALVAIALSILTLLTSTGCTNTAYKSFEIGNVTGGYNKKNAFVGVCFWDGGERTIDIPDEYSGKKITALGGYIGIGAPNPFAIVPNDKKYDFSCDESFVQADDEYETIVFTVKLGKNIQTIKRADGKSFVGFEICDENGEHTGMDIVYKIAYYFEVDSANKSFYSKDGKLYNKSDSALIQDFYYE